MEPKRVLMVATIATTIGMFNMENIRILQDLGYTVDVAADFTDTSVWNSDRISLFKKSISELGVECIQFDFSRNPLKINKHISAYKSAVNLMQKRKYTFIHTHTPIASAVIRMAAHKTKTKVIYTAHGFHFYKGAPLKNWLIYYPVEKILSKWTDLIITINTEDFERASKCFFSKKILYVPGVGIDTDRFSENSDGARIKKELHIEENQIMALSVGELNNNKNHETVLKTLVNLAPNILYVIVGRGELEGHLKELASKLGIQSRVRIVGYRNDVVDFYDAADIYILPSIREGLNASLMEAMASGLPCIASRIRGNVDLIDEGKGGFLFSPKSTTELENAFKKMIEANRYKMKLYNLEKIQSFDSKLVESMMKTIYGEIGV